MHNKTLNAIQFSEMTVTVSENSSSVWTIKWSSDMETGRTVAASSWSTEDSNLTIGSAGNDTVSTYATFSASDPGQYRAVNKMTDDAGSIDERAIIFIFQNNSRTYDYGR